MCIYAYKHMCPNRGFVPREASTSVLADEQMLTMLASSFQVVGSQTTLPLVSPPTLRIAPPWRKGDPLISVTGVLPRLLMRIDANHNTYSIQITPASNTFHFCHHPQPHHSQPYHTHSIIYHPSFIINGNSRYQAYSIPLVLIFPIFSRLPSLLRPPLNSVK